MALSTSACKTDEKPAEADAEASKSKPGADGDPTPDPRSEVVDAKSPAGAAKAVLDLPDDPKVEYATSLDTILDQLPAGSDEFVVMRDPSAALDLFDSLIGSHLDAFKKELEAMSGSGQIEKMVSAMGAMRLEFSKKAIDFDKGLLFSVKDEAIIFASENPNAFKDFLTAVSFGEADLPEHCVAPAAMPGYAACGDDKSKLEGLTAGKEGKKHVEALSGSLKGVDITRANVAGAAKPDGGLPPIHFSVETANGAVHLALTNVPGINEGTDFLASGAAPALGLLDSKSAFLWGRVNLDKFAKDIASAPPPIGPVAKTFTGEMFLGGLGGGGGLGVLAGVTDPYPASGMVALAGTQLDAIPKTLPDGSTVDVKVEQIEAGGTKVGTVHAVLGGNSQLAKLKELGMTPELYGFSAGKYVALTVGATADVVGKVAAYDGTQASASALAQMPSGLSRAMAAGDAAFAMHLPMDGMQTKSVREYFNSALQAMPKEQLAGSNPDQLSRLMIGGVAPFSSFSAWLTNPESAGGVVHLVVQAFGDVSSEEGKAANDAVIKIAGGADPVATYAALAKAYPDSPRVESYQERAGEAKGAVGSPMTSAFVLGVLAGVSVPAFNKYIERSRTESAVK